GLGLSAHRRRVARVVEVHRGAVRPPAGRRGAQDHVRERREVLRLDELVDERGGPRNGPPTPPNAFTRAQPQPLRTTLALGRALVFTQSPGPQTVRGLPSSPGISTRPRGASRCRW